ncbi:MAG: hypothetical protein K0S47_908 [Herbinix sp.]|nr:hypothetical protein [Herbinix sp.]
MIYVFAILCILTVIKYRHIIFKPIRNLLLFLLITAMGFTLGLMHEINPYLPSITMILENTLKLR